MNNNLNSDSFTDDTDLSSPEVLDSGQPIVDLAQVSDEPDSYPYTNRGYLVPSSSSSPDFNSRIGWVTISFRCKQINECFDLRQAVKYLLEKHLMDEWIDNAPPILLYRECLLSAQGAKLCYTIGITHFTLVLPQSLCDGVFTRYLLELISDLLQLGGKVTRLDLYIDDLKRFINIADVYDSILKGSLVSRSSSVDYDYKTNWRTGAVKKQIIRIGERASAFYCRLYDKFVETKGKYNAIRFEAELKGKLARFAIQLLLAAAYPKSKGRSNSESFHLNRFCGAIATLFASKINFCDPASNRRSDRRLRLQWYDELLKGVHKIKIELPKKEDSLQKTIVWIRESVAASIALVQEFFGDDFHDFFSGVIDYGLSKLKPAHFAKLKAARDVGVAPGL